VDIETDNGSRKAVSMALAQCAYAWVPEARILGHISAGALQRLSIAMFDAIDPGDRIAVGKFNADADSVSEARELMERTAERHDVNLRDLVFLELPDLTVHATLALVNATARIWSPEIRVLGNIRAADLARVTGEILKSAAPELYLDDAGFGPGDFDEIQMDWEIARSFELSRIFPDEGGEKEMSGMARYVIADPDSEDGNGWMHIFDEDGADKERLTRWAFDRNEGRIISADIRRGGKWREATSSEIDELEDSLKNANPEAVESPVDWDLAVSDDLPSWAVATSEPTL